MRKHLFLSVMLGLCAFSSMTVYPTSAMATVTQSPTIKVRGQIVDEQGEPMPGATVRVKGGQGGTITDLDGNFQLEVPGNYPFDKLCGFQGTRSSSSQPRYY